MQRIIIRTSFIFNFGGIYSTSDVYLQKGMIPGGGVAAGILPRYRPYAPGYPFLCHAGQILQNLTARDARGRTLALHAMLSGVPNVFKESISALKVVGLEVTIQ